MIVIPKGRIENCYTKRRVSDQSQTLSFFIYPPALLMAVYMAFNGEYSS